MRDLEGFCNRLSSRRDLHPDIELVAFGRRYPAHKVILASQSTYFDVLLRWLSERSSSSASRTTQQRSPVGDDTAQDGPPQHELALGEDVTQKGEVARQLRCWVNRSRRRVAGHVGPACGRRSLRVHE